ncbi:MAG TPA: winged helix DNA-binding domain-containing protein [Euzebya sp.]|nr:winged helix DNA-binding domain-containing protein [Euzebya sp.]
MQDRAIARWRMQTMRLSDRTYASPAAVVEGLLAVQAENHPQASWAVATRTPATGHAQMAQLFDAGVLLRTHVLRPTWHYVRPADIRWLIEVTAPRIRRTFVPLQRELLLDDATLDAAAVVVVQSLAGGTHLTREAIGERLADAGLPSEGQGLGVVMAYAELLALVCSGAMDGTRHTYALLEERAPDARRLDREEALAQLVLRYFTGHGPATERDLAYWATMTLTDVRAGLAQVADQLQHMEVQGRTYWFASAGSGLGAMTCPPAHLLQILDEYHNGYQDSRYILDADGIVPRGRQASVGMALVDGQLVGGMRRTMRAEEVRFDLDLFRALDPSEREAVDQAAQRYGAFLELTPRVHVT